MLRQSERMGIYAQALKGLKARGLVYRCFCSRADTARFVAEREAGGKVWPRDPDGAPLHAGPCAAMTPEASEARAAAGDPHTWRLRMDAALAACTGPQEGLALDWPMLDEDGAPAGTISARPRDWGDVVIARRDVPTSYHLAVVIDDARRA